MIATETAAISDVGTVVLPFFNSEQCSCQVINRGSDFTATCIGVRVACNSFQIPLISIIN